MILRQIYLKKMKWFRDRGYFGSKSKGYNAKMKRVVKEHLLGMNYKFKKEYQLKKNYKGTSLYRN